MELHHQIDQLQTDRTKFHTRHPAEDLPERGNGLYAVVIRANGSAIGHRIIKTN